MTNNVIEHTQNFIFYDYIDILGIFIYDIAKIPLIPQEFLTFVVRRKKSICFWNLKSVKNRGRVDIISIVKRSCVLSVLLSAVNRKLKCLSDIPVIFS